MWKLNRINGFYNIYKISIFYMVTDNAETGYKNEKKRFTWNPIKENTEKNPIFVLWKFLKVRKDFWAK